MPRAALLERRHRRPAATLAAPRRCRLGTQQPLPLQRVPQLVDLVAHRGALLGAHVGQCHGLLGRARLPKAEGRGLGVGEVEGGGWAVWVCGGGLQGGRR